MADVSPEEKLLNVIKKQHGKMRLKKDINLFTKINFILIGLIAIILIFFLVDIFTPDYKTPELSIELPEEKMILPVPKDWDEEKVIVEERPSISKEELVKDLNLMGIITGDNDQVIIEDKKAKKTFFLYESDRLGEFKVYDIKESGVILDYKGEKIELKL